MALKKGGLGELAGATTLFPQEPEIFEGTFAYNITLGNIITPSEFNRVCNITRLTPVLESLKAGPDTIILEKEDNLSGGQKQRLALARGVVTAQQSSIILLDEPTSSMNQKTELEICLNLFDEFKDKTLVSTLHRLYLLAHFDYIYLMQQGENVEQGSLNFLIDNGEIFNNFWSHQQANNIGHTIPTQGTFLVD